MYNRLKQNNSGKSEKHWSLELVILLQYCIPAFELLLEFAEVVSV